MKGIKAATTWFILAMVMIPILVASTFYAVTTMYAIAPEPPVTVGVPAVAACGDDNVGKIWFGYRNTENTVTTEYVGVTYRLYRLDGATESFRATGTVDSTSAFNTSYENSCGSTFRIYFIASDGVSTSNYIDMTLNDENVYKTVDGKDAICAGAEQAGLIFKVRNEDKAAWVYGSADTSAGEWNPTGTTFYSTTSNSTGESVASDGYVNYRVRTETNGTAASDTRFTDQKLLIGLDINRTGEDWQEPSSMAVAVSGIGQTITSVGCPGKVGSDGFDFCWDVADPATGKATIIRDSPIDLSFEIHSVSGVDPDDDLKFGVFTAGYVKKTLTEDMLGVVFNKDNAARDYCYSVQTVILDIV